MAVKGGDTKATLIPLRLLVFACVLHNIMRGAGFQGFHSSQDGVKFKIIPYDEITKRIVTRPILAPSKSHDPHRRPGSDLIETNQSTTNQLLEDIKIDGLTGTFHLRKRTMISVTQINLQDLNPP